jgi:CHASE2 domain-containing sensor protein
MPEVQTDILDDIVQRINKVRRKDLLPWWIKVFSWIFLVFGALGILGIVCGILGYQITLSFFGLSAKEPFSMDGIVIIGLLLFKAIVSYGLLWEQGWAVVAGIIDAILGILICIIMVFYSSYRLELVFLIPYLIRLLKIKSQWEQSVQIT